MNRLISRSVEQHVPLNVHFDLTYRCNERCVHCYLDHEDYGELSTAEVKSILDQLAAAGTLFLTFSGGEIFLRKDIFELLDYAKKLHFDLSLKTNALLINVDRARRLRELSLRKIQISIYSANPDVHDAITKVRGSLDRSIQAIRFLKDQGLQVKIACPLMKQNLTDFRNVQALAEQLNVPYMFDLTITPKMDGDMGLLAMRNAAPELLPVLQDPVLNPRVKAASSSAQATGMTGSSVSSGLESELYRDIPCSAGHNSCYVSPYGDVYPCVQMPLPTGNLRQQRFDEVWYESSQMQKVRSVRESHLPLCSTCSIRKFCERCPGLAQIEGGDLLGPYERACELAELNARLAGVENPISAFHKQRTNASVDADLLPSISARSGLVQLSQIRAS
ncbi:MAG: radical SAM/SPASM domain-containing protein [Candidatus Acidiferrales bacterium]